MDLPATPDFKKHCKVHRAVLEDIVSDECDGRSCLLKDLILQLSYFDDRMLEQLKCIEKFKYEESQRQKKDIGWDKAVEVWVEKGYAKKFAEIYTPDKSFRQLYLELKKNGHS